ncbi:MAG TPA: O-antigen ligase family protein, partial [Acidimicrobiales bacterium]|jgi:hypothetical protein
VILVGLFAKRPTPVLALTMYAGVCDVLWRSSSAHGPYEGSKYAVIFGCTCLAVRFVKRPRHLASMGTLVLLLLPGAVIGIMKLGVANARDNVVFNLAGLIAIAVAVIGCGSLRLTSREMRGLYLVVIGPIVSMATLATISTASAASLTFSADSNLTTSGGFGPNQVSAVLCLGGLLCVLVTLQRHVGWTLRVFALVTGIWLVSQAILTFSRGGLFELVLALGCLAVTALTLSGHRARTLMAAAVLLVIAIQILSWAGAFTGGASSKRLSSTDTTQRGEIAAADVRLFLKHPVMGVGLGVSKSARGVGPGEPPHTEYTRLLAEHGVAGVFVMVILAWVSIELVRAGRGWYRMATVALVVIALAQMAHNATRIGSIAVAFGLAALLEASEAHERRPSP